MLCNVLQCYAMRGKAGAPFQSINPANPPEGAAEVLFHSNKAAAGGAVLFRGLQQMFKCAPPSNSRVTALLTTFCPSFDFFFQTHLPLLTFA